jgi:thiosulfate/3-mercaptopyruvate sulfurtransferase
MADGATYAKSDVLVSTRWLAEHLGAPGYRLIEVDVDPASYEKGHIPGAVGWNWKLDLQDPLVRDLPTKQALEEKLGKAGVTPDTTILLYGDNNNWFAAFAYWTLQYFGHHKAALVDGGLVKWAAEGRELTTEVAQVEPATYHFAGEPDERLRAYRDQVVAAIGTAQLLDIRSPAEYAGQLIAPENLPQEGAQRPGHIPTAVNVPWATAVSPDGTFKTPEELKEIYVEGKGIDGSRPVIAYCRIGERSAHSWFVLHELLGVDDVRNYDGSWTEYGSAVRVPVER